VTKKIALGLGALVAITVGGSLLAVKATPEREPVADATMSRLASGKSFPPVCDENGDTRPDPAWVGESFENDHCWAPPMPAPLDGFQASRDQIVAGMAAVESYKAKAGLYERCIRDFVAARPARGGKGAKRMEAMLVIIENHRLAASLRNREKATDQITKAINDFNQYGSDCPD
jgi:hypothetical protein